MSARDDDLLEAAAACALGVLPPDELRELESVLGGEPEARAGLAAFREVAALLPLAAEAPEPARDLRARVIARATGRAKRRPSAGRRKGDRLVRLALAAAVVLAVAVTAALVALGRSREDLARRAEGAESRIAALESRLARQDSTVGALVEPGVELLRFEGTDPGQGRLRLFLDRVARDAILHASDLPAPGIDHEYLLWLLPGGGEPTSLGAFVPGPDGRALVGHLVIPVGRNPAGDSLIVTLEPRQAPGTPRLPARFVLPLSPRGRQ